VGRRICLRYSYEYRRKVLRARRSYAYTYPHSNCYPNGNPYLNTNSHINSNSDDYSHQHTDTYCYANWNGKCHSACYSHTETSPKSTAATDSTASHNTRATSAVATPYCVAPAYFATSHNTSTDSIIAASYSSTAALTPRLANAYVGHALLHSTV
jgi:hypothetical protein